MNGRQCVESLKVRRPYVFYLGKRLDNSYDHPAIAPHVRTAAVPCDLTSSPANAEIMTASFHLTGERIFRFTHLFWSVVDLFKKLAILRQVDLPGKARLVSKVIGLQIRIGGRTDSATRD